MCSFSVNSGMVWGFGTILGPVVGGAFELYSWRWAFYINLFFGIIILPSYIFLVPSSQPAPEVSNKGKITSFDFVGVLLSAGFLVTFMVATNFGGVLFDWSGASIIALYCVSGVLLILFVLQQLFCIFTSLEHRLFPAHLLKNKEVVLLFFLIACGGTMAYVSVYYVPLYFQFTRGDSAIETAKRILPLVFLLIFGMLSNGYLMSKLGYYKPWYILGSSVGLVGAVLMSEQHVTQN